MAVDYAGQELALLQRAKRILLTFLQERLDEVNARYGLVEPDRRLALPARISLQEPPNFGAGGQKNDLPAVYLRVASSTTSGGDITTVEDMQVGVVIDVILGNPNRPLDDTTQRARLYATAVADLIQQQIRAKGSGRTGPYAARRGPGGALPGIFFDDQWVVRASDSLMIWVRYQRDTSYTLLADEDLRASHLPLSAAGVITGVDNANEPWTASPYQSAVISGPAILQTTPQNTYTLIRDQSDVDVIAGTGDPIAFPVGEYIVVVAQPDGLSPSYTITVRPTPVALLLENDTPLLLENDTPLLLED